MSRGSVRTRWRKLCSMRLASRRASGSPNPPASSAGVSPRGSSISASGLPRVSARIRVSHPLVEPDRGSSRPAAARRRRAAAPRSPAPAVPRARAASPDSRSANTKPSRSASSRRATNASVCADTRSSHCASSTTHTSGCSSAASASRLRTASPTRKRSGGGPALRPNAVRQRVALRARQTLEPAEHRRAQLHAGRRTGAPSRTRRRRRGRSGNPGRGVGEVPQQRGLADSRLAAQDQHAALARTDSGDELLEPLALAHTVQQPR